MTDYEMIKPGTELSMEKLVEMYNDAVETIWMLQHNYKALDDAYDALFYNYEQAMDQIHG